MQHSPATSALDEVARAKLHCLQENGRATHAAISTRINQSPSACHRRDQRLEAVGIKKDFVAFLELRAVGRTTTVFVEIHLSGQIGDMLDSFERAVARGPDVLECHLMAGTADYLLKAVARDSAGFAEIHCRNLPRLLHIVQMQASFALKTVCKSTALPL